MTAQSYQPNDIAALEALRFAMVACNGADTTALHYQHGGAYGYAYEGLLNAATALFGPRKARLFLDIIIDSGENVAYCLDYIDKNYEQQPLTDDVLDRLADGITDLLYTDGFEHGIDISHETATAVRAALPAFVTRIRATTRP
jgi:hypothetical protein